MHYRHLLPCCCLSMALLAIMSAPAFAQQEDNPVPSPAAESEASDNQASPQPRDPDARNAQSAPATTEPPEPVFKPSEEISEDLSVPFPVDI